MKCPFCGHDETKVVDSRVSESQESIRRRRECLVCEQRFTTYERIEEMPLMVLKKDGRREPFDRGKLMRGLVVASVKRNVSAQQLERLIDDVESELRNTFRYEIPAKSLGDVVLEHLRTLDKVAYVRFASVYKDFQDLDEFTRELKGLKCPGTALSHKSGAELTPVRLDILRLDTALPLPAYAHAGDAGLDLFSAVDVVLEPHQRALIPTGIAVAIPEGYAGFVQPRSGLALRAGLSLVNTPGLIDSHYRGEIKVIAINLDPVTPIRIARGDRIAQLVVQQVVCCELAEVTELPATARGEGGFGSTGQ